MSTILLLLPKTKKNKNYGKKTITEKLLEGISKNVKIRGNLDKT